MKIILAALGLLATATVVSAAEGPGNSAETPGHEMQEHSSEHEGTGTHEEEDQGAEYEESDHEGAGLDVHIGKEPSHEEEEHEEEH